jgi:hypothetical protein
MKTLLALAVMLLLLLYVWERVEVVRVGYQIERLLIRLEPSSQPGAQPELRLAKHDIIGTGR